MENKGTNRKRIPSTVTDKYQLRVAGHLHMNICIIMAIVIFNSLIFVGHLLSNTNTE